MKVFILLIPLLYLVGNLYIFLRGGQALPSLPVVVKVLLSILYWCGALSFLGEFLFRDVSLSPSVAHLSARMGSSWLAFTLYMAVALLAFDLLRLFHIHCPYSFYIAFCLTLCLFIYGNYHYHHPKTRVINKVINKSSTALDRPLKAVAVSDIHLGYATNRPMLSRYVDMINAEQPDIVWIGGDLVDHNVTPLRKEHMEEELARIKAPLGIYMVLGNHEYISGDKESVQFIRETSITLLQDSVVVLPNGIQLVGRDDRSNPRRKSLAQLTAGLDQSKPIIVLDHQPYDLEETAKAGVDLQFSGHTHRGQLWPISWLADRLFELSYGQKEIGDCLICVSSGLSLWGPPFRIGTDSEMVVFQISFKH